MPGRNSRRRPSPSRRMTPLLEGLDTRVLLSWGGVGPRLGHFVAPAAALPRGIRPAITVDPHRTINHFLGNRLGPGVDRISRQVELQGGASNNLVAEQVLAQKAIHSILSHRDTYTLLNSVQPNALAQGSTSGTTAEDTVTYQIPDEAIIMCVWGQDGEHHRSAGDEHIPRLHRDCPDGRTFEVRHLESPSQLRPEPERSRCPVLRFPRTDLSQRVNRSSIAALSEIFTSTGPVVVGGVADGPPPGRPERPPDGPRPPTRRRLRSQPGPRRGPDRRIPPRLPGGRRPEGLQAQRPSGGSGLPGFRAVPGPGHAARSSPERSSRRSRLPAPALPSGRLNGTLEVSLGAFRNLAGIDPSLSGLQLPGIGNFPGRIDVGYVFDRAGNFGIALTARGPLASAPAGVASANVIGGDIRIEVSDAPNLAALNGTRTVEGLTQGSPSAGGLESSRYASGISTFAASTGYGAGFEFGTGTAYTQVIPLGNVYALVPEFPGAEVTEASPPNTADHGTLVRASRFAFRRGCRPGETLSRPTRRRRPHACGVNGEGWEGHSTDVIITRNESRRNARAGLIV